MDIFFIMVGIVAAAIIIPLVSSHSGRGEADYTLNDITDRIDRHGADVTRLETADKYMDELQTALDVHGSSASQKTLKRLKVRYDDMAETYNMLLEEKWESKAYQYLDDMDQGFRRLLVDNIPFNDLDSITRLKRHILSSYDAYWEWTRKCHDSSDTRYTTINLWDKARDQIKEYFSHMNYDIGVTTWYGDEARASVRGQIEQRLNAHVDTLRPEYVRKKKLAKAMVDAVAKEDTMMRADLMKMDFHDADRKEVESTYRMLVKTNRLFEMKEGSRYWVSLSDKEKSKHKPKADATPLSEPDDAAV